MRRGLRKVVGMLRRLRSHRKRVAAHGSKRMRECSLLGREQARLLRVQQTTVQRRQEDIDIVVDRRKRGAARAAMQRQSSAARAQLKIY